MTHEAPLVSREAHVLEYFEELARHSLGNLTPEQCLHGERRIQKAMARRALRGRLRGRVFAAVALVSVTLGAVAYVRHIARPEPLAYSVVDGYLGSAQSVSGNGSASPLVRFSDGTEVQLAQDALARVRFVTPNGAGLAIERGYLHAQVKHSSKSEWQFDAGPFTVRVTGTSFGLTWVPEKRQFDLRLEQGSVTVAGPVANEPIPVRAGQWLTIQTNEVLIRDIPPQTAEQPPLSAQAPMDASVESVETGSNHPINSQSMDEPRLRSAIPEPLNWAAELARGHLEAIVKDAQSRGLDSCLTKASSSELSALADAARYTRNNDLAQKALLAIRQRFAGSRKATETAFLLGKLAETSRNEAGALAFFDIYLNEAPGGTYASEALGRKMAIVRNTSGSSIARPLARNYLVKYPHGTYAAAAQAIIDNP